MIGLQVQHAGGLLRVHDQMILEVDVRGPVRSRDRSHAICLAIVVQRIDFLPVLAIKTTASLTGGFKASLRASELTGLFQ